MVAFNDVAQSDAVAEMIRYLDVKVVIVGDGICGERVSGRFPVGESGDFAESLELFLPVEVARVGGRIERRQAK